MDFTFTSESLKISASNGVLTVWADNVPDRIEELSLSKLERVYKKWQHLIKEVGENIAQTLLNDKRVRNEIFKILKEFGFKRYQNFNASQIKSLLFYHENDHSLLWQFHSVYPTLELPTEEENIDYDKYLPGLNPFETAQFYLLQNDSLGLIDTMPLSKIMKLFVSKAFISWISDPANKEKIRAKEFEDYIDNNPLDPDDILRLMSK